MEIGNSPGTNGISLSCSPKGEAVLLESNAFAEKVVVTGFGVVVLGC